MLKATRVYEYLEQGHSLEDAMTEFKMTRAAVQLAQRRGKEMAPQREGDRKIYEYVTTENHSVDEAAVHFSIQRDSVLKALARWRRATAPTGHGGAPSKFGERDKDIYEYVKAGHDRQEAAQHFNILPHTVSTCMARYAKKLGREAAAKARSAKPSPQFARGEKGRAIAQYVKDGHTLHDAAEHFNITLDNARVATRKYAPALAPFRAPKGAAYASLPYGGKQAAISEYMLQGHSQMETALHFGISVAAVRDALGRLKRQKDGKGNVVVPRNIAPRAGIVFEQPKLTKEIYYFAKLVDKEIVKEAVATGEISQLARTVLVLTNEIHKLERNGE